MSLSNIKSWSTAAASNNDAATGGMPENQAPSTVNDNVRVQMAAHRTQWEDAEWFNWGHTIANNSASEFTATITGTHSASGTNVYAISTRVKCYDGSSTFYGTIISISAAAANQWKVAVSLDSGALTSSLTQVAVGILSPVNNSIPRSLTVNQAVLLTPTMTLPIINGVTITSSTIASQTIMEAASSNNCLVSPGRMIYHPGACKAWGQFNSSGTLSSPSHGISGVVRNGTGDYTVTLSTAQSSSVFVIVANAVQSSHNALSVVVNPTATTTFDIHTSNSATGAASDVAVNFAVFGDL